MKPTMPILAAALLIFAALSFKPAPAEPAPPVSSDPMLGEIIMFAGNFAPRGWAICDGTLLNVSEHTALFSILGTTYGGDGRTTFGLPDLRGRAPIGVGNADDLYPVTLGQKDRKNAKGGGGVATLGMNYIIALQGTFPSRN